ncbi:MAG: hypothetical protein WBC60_14035 [Cognaticolwellia sp.]
MSKIVVKKIALFVFSYISLIGCANVVEHKSRVYKGENLVTPYTGFLAGWHVSVKNQKDYHSSIWQHPTEGLNDAYIVSVTLPTQNEIAYYRNIIDQPGYDSCIKFTSTTLKSVLTKEYPSETWQTNCKKTDGNEAKILHFILQGHDSFYHIQKIWQDNFIAQDIDNWQNRFKQIYLCDSRKESTVCPD